MRAFVVLVDQSLEVRPKHFENVVAKVAKQALEHAKPPGIEAVEALVLLQGEKPDELVHLGLGAEEAIDDGLALVEVAEGSVQSWLLLRGRVDLHHFRPLVISVVGFVHESPLVPLALIFWHLGGVVAHPEVVLAIAGDVSAVVINLGFNFGVGPFLLLEYAPDHMDGTFSHENIVVIEAVHHELDSTNRKWCVMPAEDAQHGHAEVEVAPMEAGRVLDDGAQLFHEAAIVVHIFLSDSLEPLTSGLDFVLGWHITLGQDHEVLG